MNPDSYEQCPRCKEPFTSAGKNFCANCGAPIDSTSSKIRALIDEALKTRFKDQQHVALETSVAVADKLTTWLKLFLYWAAIPLALIAILLGIGGVRTYGDFTSKVTTAESQIEKVSTAAQTVAESARQKASGVSSNLARIERDIMSTQRDLSELQRLATTIKGQYGQLQSDVDRYKKVNEKIDEVQKQLTAVKGQIVDLGSSVVRAAGFESTGTTGPSSWSLKQLGCGPSALANGYKVAYCAEGSPTSPFLSQRTLTGDVRPVASVSPVGFQDASSGPKPTCNTTNRGTFYVEKAMGTAGDKPFLCIKKSDNTYAWVQLGMIP